MSTRITDMTTGKPAGLIFRFALPLMLGNIFQQLYIMVDTMIVGKGVGVHALAALGAVDWLNWMTIGIVTGFTQGFSILFAQRYGASDQNGFRKSIAMSVILAGGIGVLLTIASLIAAMPVLRFLNTPDHIIGMSFSYLQISFSGIIILMAYNLTASILRALGNGRAPLFAMAVAAAVNVVLDLLFVLKFGWGVRGAAIATVIAQLCSFLICFYTLRQMSELRIKREDWKSDKGLLKRLLGLGAPIAMQNAIIAVGGMVVQFVVNGFGLIFIAGFTATNKLYGLLEIAATSFGFSVSTYTAQNFGAAKYERIREGIKKAVLMAILTSIIIGLAMLLFGETIVGWFASGKPEEVEQVVQVAYRYLKIMSVLLFILYLLHVYRAALQGLGNTIIPMISGFVELVMRVGVALILPIYIQENGIFYAEVVAWTGAELILMISYHIIMKKHRKSNKSF